MEISLYTGSENPAEYYTDFLTQNKINFKIKSVNSESVITVYANDEQTELLTKFICRFMLEYYLKEAIFSKIYDEYDSFSIEDATTVLASLCDELMLSPLKNDIKNLLASKRVFKLESYILFNIKPIMKGVYALIDKIAISIIYKKEKERLQSAIRFLKGLSFDKCESADDDF